MTYLIANILILFANLAVFGFVLKLYTEYFKDRSIAERKTSVKDSVVRSLKHNNPDDGSC